MVVPKNDDPRVKRVPTGYINGVMGHLRIGLITGVTGVTDPYEWSYFAPTNKTSDWTPRKGGRPTAHWNIFGFGTSGTSL